MFEDFASEIAEIPQAAKRFFETPSVALPHDADYVGMGASFNAALTLALLGEPIRAWSAEDARIKSTGPLVLISQSGKSAETLALASNSQGVKREYVAITNDPTSPLALGATQLVDLQAGPEKFLTSSKSYVNTLLALYRGLGHDIAPAVKALNSLTGPWKDLSAQIAQEVLAIPKVPWVVLGGGANVATAMQGALTMMESTRHPVLASSYASFDHGPKEAFAAGGVIFALRDAGPTADRADRVLRKLAGRKRVLIITLRQEIDWARSPITFSRQLNFITLALCTRMNLSASFIGGKVNEI